MIRQGPWKLNFYQGYDEPQLFNLEEDPDEFEGRAGDLVCDEVKAKLLERVRAGCRPRRGALGLVGGDGACA